MIPTLVTIKNGVVDQVQLFGNAEEVEAAFIAENEAYGRDTNEDELEDGYVELEDVTICISWADLPHIDLLNLPPILKNWILTNAAAIGASESSAQITVQPETKNENN